MSALQALKLAAERLEHARCWVKEGAGGDGVYTFSLGQAVDYHPSAIAYLRSEIPKQELIVTWELLPLTHHTDVLAVLARAVEKASREIGSTTRTHRLQEA